MSDYDRYDQPRSRTTIAVVVAVVLLTVLGGSVGYILATANRDGKDTGAAVAPPTPTAGPATPSTSGTKKNPPATATTTRKTYPSAGPGDCPKQSVEAAGVSLLLVKFLKTARSEVWICRDQPGNLFYQGHIRGRDFSAATSDDSIFLRGVVLDGDVYKATNGDTVYFVEPDRLRVEKGGKVQVDEPAVNG